MTSETLRHFTPPTGRVGLVRFIATLIRNPIESLHIETYRQPYLLWTMGPLRAHVVCRPDLVERLLVQEHEGMEKSLTVRRSVTPALGDGLLTAEGARWRDQRRLTAPLFRPDRVHAMLPQMVAAADRASDRLADAGVIDIAHEMMETTFDIIVSTMFSRADSLDVPRFAQAITDYLDSTGWRIGIASLRLPDWLPFPGRSRSSAAALYLRRSMADLLAARRATPTADDDLVARFLAARDPATGDALTDTEIIDNLLTFIAAGHETTALALTWTLWLLGRYPAEAERVRAEIADIAADGRLDATQLDRLPRTGAVLNESLRLFPPVPMLGRDAVAEIDLGPDMQIRKGDTILIPIWAIHRHETLWDDPDGFHPERFAPGTSRARCAFMPFGAGPRICIGATFASTEALAVLARLLAKYRFTPISADLPKTSSRTTLRPLGGLPMRVERV